MTTKLKLLIATAAVLVAVLIWQLISGGGPAIDSIDARMEKLRQAGDVEGLAAEGRSSDILAARRAVETLGYLGPKAVEHIEPFLADPRAEIRQRAATAYAKAADSNVAPPLAKVARTDTSPVVRAAAVTVLGQARVYGEMDTLLTAMNDEDVVVRRRAADAVTLILSLRHAYDPKGSSAQRLKAIAVIRQFWEPRKDFAGKYFEGARKRRKDEAEKSQ